ncbi:MAG: hypothetical protein WCK48_03180 [bacterium]
MSPEDKELLRRSIALAEENNDILRGIQRSMRLARFMSILYWVIIIGVSVGAFYVAQPYLKSVSDLYGSAKGQINNVSDVLNNLKGL